MLALVGLAGTAIAFFADVILPQALFEWLGTLAVGRIILGMALAIVLLVAWVIYLHPRLSFDEKSGALVEKGSGKLYCHKCRADKKGKFQLHRQGQYTWRCRVCDNYYEVEKPA